MRTLTAAYRPPSVGERARAAIRDVGIAAVVVRATRWLAQYAAGLPSSVFGTSGAFHFGGRSYTYLAHRHNYTWLNERAVEVPIARVALADAGDGRVLEVGNVLSHYGSVSHLVIDRYERAPGVINADVLAFEDDEGFELIVSVSTLEHVGWDERPRDGAAAERAFAHLTQLLAPGGSLLVTLPVGYNLTLDKAIRDGRLGLSELRALRREELRNTWREVDPAEVWDAPYDSLLCTAHGIVVCHAQPSAPLATGPRIGAGAVSDVSDPVVEDKATDPETVLQDEPEAAEAQDEAVPSRRQFVRIGLTLVAVVAVVAALMVVEIVRISTEVSRTACIQRAQADFKEALGPGVTASFAQFDRVTGENQLNGCGP
jgi:hypothetical protein